MGDSQRVPCILIHKYIHSVFPFIMREYQRHICLFACTNVLFSVAMIFVWHLSTFQVRIPTTYCPNVRYLRDNVILDNRKGQLGHRQEEITRLGDPAQGQPEAVLKYLKNKVWFISIARVLKGNDSPCGHGLML